ncbi:MAG: hypothetical protein ACREPQ_04775 [Rhodanobacter sp.]
MKSALDGLDSARKLKVNQTHAAFGVQWLASCADKTLRIYEELSEQIIRKAAKANGTRSIFSAMPTGDLFPRLDGPRLESDPINWRNQTPVESFSPHEKPRPTPGLSSRMANSRSPRNPA